MSLHRRNADTAIHRGSRRLGSLLRPPAKPRPRHKAGRAKAAQPAHA